jgi:hypothetical protein
VVYYFTEWQGKNSTPLGTGLTINLEETKVIGILYQKTFNRYVRDKVKSISCTIKMIT